MRIYGFVDEASSDINEQILAMKRNGLDGVEIRNVDGVNISDITVAKAQEVRKKLSDNGLTVWSIGSPIGKIDIVKDDFNEHLDKFRHTLELAKVLETENIRLFSFYMPEGRNPEDYRNEVIDRMGQLLDVAKGSGVTLCHENEKGIYGDDAKHCLELFHALPQLKGVFDPANFVQCGQDTLEAWKLLHPYIKYLHIKDACADGSIVPAGKGAGNISAIISAYQAQGGDVLSMEPHLAVFQGLSALEREGEKSNISAYAYKDNQTAFDAGCAALRTLLLL